MLESRKSITILKLVELELFSCLATTVIVVVEVILDIVVYGWGGVFSYAGERVDTSW